MSETHILRVLIEVEEAADKGSWEVRFSLPEQPAHVAWQPRRALRKTQVGEHYFPGVDPEKEAGLPDPGEPHYDLCTGEDSEALGQIYSRIIQRAPVVAEKHVSRFGKYLFDTLIGRQIWQEIVAFAETEQADVVELALAWKPDQLDLHRLNWELMHGLQSFLAARQPTRPREVAITRIVLDATWKARTMGAVPCSLFVIGTSLTDPRVRPGAEYLGLLRQIERSGRAIHTRVLRGQEGLGTTPNDLRRAMAEFKPELVHFICHGVFDEWGGAQLELAADPGEPEGSKLRGTEQIFQYLSEGKNLPAIVVLSACNTGQSEVEDLLAGVPAEEETGRAPEVAMRGAHETAPMAAQLVNRGIPVVIGMAGRVADSACRHFTRRFGEAITRGEPLVIATAEGRRAAFAYDDQSPEESVDWAFPAVFLSAEVPSWYTPAAPADAAEIPPVESWVANYHPKLGREPVFCGRHEFFDAYYDLFDITKPSVLCAYVIPPTVQQVEDLGLPKQEPDRWFGMTRLLRELTDQAIRDGHIPIVISSDPPKPPKTLADLLTELIKALNHARDVYQIEKTSWQISALKSLLEGGADPLDDDVREVYEDEEGRKVTARVIQEALAVDMTYLIQKAHAKYPFLEEAKGSAVLFLDDVDKYDQEFLEGWFDGVVLGSGGLRRGTRVRRLAHEPFDPARSVLPVVMTYSTAGPGDIILKPIRERSTAHTWLRQIPLTAFPPNDDLDLLAYEHVLLNPFDENGELRAGVSNRAYALNHKTQPDNWETWAIHIREEFGGLPRYFETKQCYRTVFIASRSEFLIEADDERRLEAYMKKDDDQ